MPKYRQSQHEVPIVTIHRKQGRFYLEINYTATVDSGSQQIGPLWDADCAMDKRQVALLLDTFGIDGNQIIEMIGSFAANPEHKQAEFGVRGELLYTK